VQLDLQLMALGVVMVRLLAAWMDGWSWGFVCSHEHRWGALSLCLSRSLK